MELSPPMVCTIFSNKKQFCSGLTAFIVVGLCDVTSTLKFSNVVAATPCGKWEGRAGRKKLQGLIMFYNFYRF